MTQIPQESLHEDQLHAQRPADTDEVAAVDCSSSELIARDVCGLTGTHVGCDTSQCGACMVLLDGAAVKSCTLLALSLRRPIAHDDRGPRQPRRSCIRCRRRFIENHGLQCGFCTPGMVMTAIDIASRNPSPTEEECGAGSRATSAAAPAIRTSSTSVIAGAAAMQQNRCGLEENDMVRRSSAIGAAPQAQGRPPLPHRTRQICRRHQAAGHDIRRVRALAPRACADQGDRRRRRRSRCPACSSVFTGERYRRRRARHAALRLGNPRQGRRCR